MKQMKCIFAAILCGVLILVMCSGCEGTSTSSEPKVETVENVEMALEIKGHTQARLWMDCRTNGVDLIQQELVVRTIMRKNSVMEISMDRGNAFGKMVILKREHIKMRGCKIKCVS